MFSFLTFEGIYNRSPQRRRFPTMRIRELDVPPSENRFKHAALAALRRALSTTSTDFSSSLPSFISLAYCLCQLYRQPFDSV